MPHHIDWLVVNHGSLFTFMPITEAAIAHGEEHFPEDAQRIRSAYAVEHRYAEPIIDDLIAHGFTLSRQRAGVGIREGRPAR